MNSADGAVIELSQDHNDPASAQSHNNAEIHFTFNKVQHETEGIDLPFRAHNLLSPMIMNG